MLTVINLGENWVKRLYEEFLSPHHLLTLGPQGASGTVNARVW
jgi:hypothetical protein